MNRADLQQLANLRIAEAKALLAAGFPAGAYYLAGYAIECALKACIARAVQQYDFPDKERVIESYQHHLVRLLKPAGLENELKDELCKSKAFNENWAIVKDWKETTRYSSSITISIASSLITAIDDPKDGVLPWLVQRW
jgi:hypothetical protein